MRLCSIASGSSGNCIYVGDEDTHLLVDAGISKKRVEEGLHTLRVTGEKLSGILVTHEHIDHIQGLGRKEPLKESAAAIRWENCRRESSMRSGWTRRLL